MSHMNGAQVSPAESSTDRTHSSEEEAAARLIQRTYRGHVGRTEANGLKLAAHARWTDALKESGHQTYASQQLENKNDIPSRWSRAVHAASRMQKGDGLVDDPAEPREGYDEVPELSEKVLKGRRAKMWGSLSVASRMYEEKGDGQGDGQGKGQEGGKEGKVLPYTSKALEQQHWLEMIDGKHRYGSNMKYYFRKWKESDTEDNFFRWLDRGEGKDLDLEELPRERLERERIIYLSAEQRLNYLVKVDPDGLLRWVHNNEYVDTADKKWKDSGNGTGITPDESYAAGGGAEDEAEAAGESDASSIVSDSYSATSSVLDENEDTHYAGLDEKKKGGWVKEKTRGITPGGIRKELLRKTVRRNTWIYVSDLKVNLFIGIKKSGAFQHSSFLGGGKVTSAGLIVVKRGVIKSINPLSGHYRSSIEHFRAFIAQLEAKGADLSHVKIAKSVLTLWGLSKYASITKGQKDLTNRFKSALGLSHDPTEAEKSEQLQENAEREEREHQERLRAVHEAEEGAEGEEKKAQVRKEVLYGRKRAVPTEQAEVVEPVDGPGTAPEEARSSDGGT